MFGRYNRTTMRKGAEVESSTLTLFNSQFDALFEANRTQFDHELQSALMLFKLWSFNKRPVFGTGHLATTEGHRRV